MSLLGSIGRIALGFFCGLAYLAANAASVGNVNLLDSDFTLSAGGIQPGTGSTPPTLSLAFTGVTSGTYTNPTLNILSNGRIQFATNGSGSTGGITGLTGAVIATGPGNVPATLSSTGVTPGFYTLTSLTVGVDGRITAAANGSGGAGTVTTTGSPTGGNLTKFSGATSITNADLSGDATTSGTTSVTLSTTGVISGTYTLATVSVNSKGLVTSASSGSAGTGTVTSIGTGTGLQGGTITSSGTISLTNTAVTPGSYTNTSLTVDQQGRLTAASSGGAGTGTVNNATSGFLAFYATTGTAVSGVNNVPVSTGGTGASTLTNHGVLLGQGTSAVVAVAPGTVNQVLTSSGATLDPLWRTPGDQLLFETVTSGSAPSVTFASIPQTFRDLEIRIRGRGTTVASNVIMAIQLNGDTAGNYQWEKVGWTATAADGPAQFVAQTSFGINQFAAASATANYASYVAVTIPDYRGTTFFKNLSAYGGGSLGNGGFTQQTNTANGAWSSTAAVTSIKVLPVAGAFVDGSVVSLYGHM